MKVDRERTKERGSVLKRAVLIVIDVASQFWRIDV